MTTIMFEQFRAPSLYIQNTSVLSLYTTGRKNGVVLDCGDDSIKVVPIYEGFKITNAISQSLIGGRNLTDYLIELLSKKNIEFQTSEERRCACDIKEKLCYVAP